MRQRRSFSIKNGSERSRDIRWSILLTQNVIPWLVRDGFLRNGGVHFDLVNGAHFTNPNRDLFRWKKHLPKQVLFSGRPRIVKNKYSVYALRLFHRVLLQSADDKWKIAIKRRTHHSKAPQRLSLHNSQILVDCGIWEITQAGEFFFVDLTLFVFRIVFIKDSRDAVCGYGGAANGFSFRFCVLHAAFDPLAYHVSFQLKW